MSEPRDYSASMHYTAVDGAIVAVNAIPDCALVIDAPSCSAFKGERVHGNHDCLSTLSLTDRLRFHSSNLTINELAQGIDDELLAAVERAGRVDGISVVLLMASSLVTITGKQYVHIMDEMDDKIEPPIIEIPSRDLYGDWLDGFGDTLASLARELPLTEPEGPRPENRVAVVGYLMDRTEADHLANLAELHRLLSALELETVSVWLSGEPTAGLADAGLAGAIIALPHGKRAARIMSGRTGARLIEAPLPVGLDQTAAFLRSLGAGFGREAQAEAIIKAGEKETLPKLRWIVPRSIMDRNYALFAEPFLLEGVVDTLTLLGARARALFCPTLPTHVPRGWADRFDAPVLFEPTMDAVYETLERLQKQGCLDICIGGTLFLSIVKALNVPLLEFGFPSYYTHHFVGLPYLGYQGFLGLVERFANTMAREEFLRFDK